MCIKAVKKEAETLEYVPDQYKTREVCERAVEDDLNTLITL